MAGAVVASIPNVRNVRTLFDLVLRGRWDYTEYGVLDRTHLRFFTPTSMLGPVHFDGLRRSAARSDQPAYAWAPRLASSRLGGRLDTLIAEQFVVVGSPSEAR